MVPGSLVYRLKGGVNDAYNCFILLIYPSIVGARLYFWLFGVFLFIFSLMGMLMNIINVYALSKTLKTNRRPMYHFLLTMAVLDTLVSYPCVDTRYIFITVRGGIVT